LKRLLPWALRVCGRSHKHNGTMEFEITTLLLLALVGFAAGFIDSIAGGGGLLALPSLLLAGLDPVSALATNKLQGTFGTASATHTFWKKGLLKPLEHKTEVALVFVAAAIGVLCVSYAPTQILQAAMPVLLICVALYFAFSPNLSAHGSKARLPIAAFTFAVAPLVGFYDGIFGPGTGSFFMLALVSLFGLNLIEATGRTKLLNFTSNIASLLVFILGGKIIWVIGFTMGAAQLIGAQLGARLAITNGAKIIRPLLVIVCIAMAIRLLLDPQNPLRQMLKSFYG
jgi:uncharacterized protein